MKVVDLFCGCGGMSLGLQNAGFEIVAAYDNWGPAITIYRKNFTHPVYNKDLLDLDSVDDIIRFTPEMIVGGPPCQDFSISGKRNFAGKRANLTTRFAEIVSAIKPEWFIMENVYNIEKSPVLPLAIETLQKVGYGLTKRVIDASYCGVPQTRKRFFLIGHLGDEDGFLNKIIENHLSTKRMTVHDYLGDSLDTEFYYMHPRNYSRRAVFSVYEPSATIRGINRPIPTNYKTHPADKARISDGVRCLTTKERSYLQTFPRSFQLEGAKTDIELAIGNAVPVNLARYVGLCVAEYVAQKKERN